MRGTPYGSGRSTTGGKHDQNMMRAGDNFHSELGYLAPAPKLLRTVRVVLLATLVGAVGGAAAVLSLHPDHGEDISVAARTMVSEASGSVAKIVDKVEPVSGHWRRDPRDAPAPSSVSDSAVEKQATGELSNQETNGHVGPPAPAVAASRQPAEAQGNMPKIPEPKERRVRVLHKGGGSYARSATKRREEHTARLGFSAEPSPFFQSW
jgi:hypothetical protein